MEVSGVRSSWLTMPRNSARSRSISSIGVMSCMVTTTDSTSPSSERMDVALIRVVTLRPSGAWRTISSARTVSPVLSAWARGNSSRETSLPSARRKVSTSSSCSAEPPGAHRSLTIRLASRLSDTGVPRPGVEDQDAHGSRVHQGLQAGPGPPLVPVPAGVGDDQRGLGGEHHQGLFVFGGELHILLADVEGPDALPLVADGRGEEGQNGADRHRRAELGKAQRPGVAVEVPQSQRFGNPAEVLEELQPFGQLHKSLALFRSQPGGDEVLYPPRLIQQGDDAVAGPGQRAGAVQDPLEHRVEVEALVDAQAGLAEPGQPVPQLRYLPRLIVCLVHFAPRNGLPPAVRCPSLPRRAGCGMRERARPGQPQL